MFIRRANNKITILIVYVNDMVVTGDDSHEVSNLEAHLAREFEIKDLGPFRYFLGIEVARSSSGIFISQMKFVLDLF